MRLAEFIRSATPRIVADWCEFARTCVPELDFVARRDHIEGILATIARDLETPQTPRAQADKAMGTEDRTTTPAANHGSERAASGYTPGQMVAEFRALRASVMRLWSAAKVDFDRTQLDEVTRFNESIDQALAESMARYTHDVARSKDLFLGVLGHDLRNPLGAIVMAVTVMMAHEGPAWPHLKTATRILNAGGRMELIISDLLDFTRSRLGAGVPIVRAEMDLVEICQETIDEITSFHPGCVVVFDATEPLRGAWDRGRIGQALSNLIGNAYQHGTRKTPVTVVLRGDATTATVTVHNQGRPIPPAHLHEIFDPFRQVPSDGAAQSTSIGLGLFIVRAIVTAHGGTIDVTSTDAGTTFAVQLPRHAASDGQALLVGK